MSHSMTLQREIAARRLAAMLTGHGDEIAKRLAPRMAKVLKEGEEMPDVAHLLDVLGRMVRAESVGLAESDIARGSKGGARGWARRQLKEEVPVLRGRVIEVRDLLRQHYGTAEAKRLLRGDGRTPRGVEDLTVLAERMVLRLPSLKKKETPGVQIDPSGWAESLRPITERTRDLFDQVEQGDDNVSIAVEKKDKVLVAFDKTYRQVLRLGDPHRQTNPPPDDAVVDERPTTSAPAMPPPPRCRALPGRRPARPRETVRRSRVWRRGKRG